MMEQKNGAEGIFRPMRRKKQALSMQECEAVLKRGNDIGSIRLRWQMVFCGRKMCLKL